jgi:hypothetical protein
LVAGTFEIHHMRVQRNVLLEDLLLLFSCVETVTMVTVYWESGKLPYPDQGDIDKDVD